MRKFEKPAAIFLALCLCLGLAACGRTEGQPQESAPAETEAPEEELAEQLVYREEDLPGGIVSLDCMDCLDGETVLAGRDSEGGLVLGVIGAQGDFEALALPGDVISVDAACKTAEGVAVLASNGPEDFILSYTGGEAARVDLNAEAMEDVFGGQALAELDGKWYIMHFSGVVEFSADGQTARCCEIAEDWDTMASMQAAGGRIYVSMTDMDENGGLFELDTENMGFTPVDTGDMGVTALGLTAEGGLLLSGKLDGREVVAELGEDGPVEFFDWADTGIAYVDCSGLWEFSDDSYAVFRAGAPALERLRPELMKLRTQLRLLTDCSEGEIAGFVNDFNQTNEDYVLRVEYLFDDYDGDIESLNAQLIAGEGPDILAIGDYSYLAGLDAEATEDLGPWLDAETEYPRELYLPGLLSAMGQDGKLAALPYAFSIVTFSAPSDAFSEPGTGYDEAKAAANEAGLPLFRVWLGPDNLWSWVCEFSAVTFTEPEAGACYFDSGEYQNLLRECGEMMAVYSDDSAGSADGLLRTQTLRDISDMGAVYDEYGGEYTFVGLPNDRTNGSMFGIEMCFAISAQSANKDGAWQFVRRCIAREPDALWNAFPANAELFEQELLAAVGADMDYLGEACELTEADAAKLSMLVEGTEAVQHSLPAVADILNEVAADYFAGEISLEEAVANSQQRVSDWLAGK